MIVYYISNQAINHTTREGLHVLAIALYPILPWMQSIVYWTISTVTVATLISTESLKVYAAYRTHTNNPNHLKRTPHWRALRLTQPPLPGKYMVLAGVMLCQSLISWIEKLDQRYGGLVDSTHQLAINTIHQINTTHKQSIITTKR